MTDTPKKEQDERKINKAQAAIAAGAAHQILFDIRNSNTDDQFVTDVADDGVKEMEKVIKYLTQED